MISQMRLFGEIGGMVLAREGRSFVIDKDNESVINLLIAYVNRWSDTLQTIGSKYFGTSVDPDRSLMIMGDKGVGKTLLMQVTARLCEVLGLTESGFVNTSSSELLNYFRTNSSLDYFTYNSGRVAVKEGNPYSAKPFNVCLHDLDYQHDEKQKHYGVSMQDVMEDFLMARYELWQNQGLKYHVSELRQLFFTTLQIPDWSYESIKSTPMSGEARKQLFIDCHLKVKDESGRLLEMFDREVSVVKAFLSTILPEAVRGDLEALSVENVITPYTMDDDRDTLSNIALAVNNRLMSRKEGIQMLGWSKDVDKTYGEIMEEAEEDVTSHAF